MKKIIQYFIIPTLIAIIAATSALLGLWSKLPTPRNLIDFSTSLPVACILCLCTLSTIQSILNIKEKIKDSKKVSFAFRLRCNAEPDLHIENKYKNDGSINGLLTIIIEKGKNKEPLLQRQISYSEILGGPSEITYLEETISEFSSVKHFKNSHFKILFEPTESSFWTRNVYDKDSLKYNLLDAPLTSNGEQQVLIHSSSLRSRVSEFLSNFPEPESVLRVERKGYKANKEDSLPILLHLFHHISFYVNREKLLEFSSSDFNLCHHFAIGAILGKNGLQKFSLFYATEITIAIDRKGIQKIIDYHPRPKATDIEEFYESLLK